MGGKVTCPKCGKMGRLEIQQNDRLRVNHDKMIKGIRITKRCTLGSLSGSIKRLETVSQIRPDVISPSIATAIEKAAEIKQKLAKMIKESPYATLVSNVIQLANNLGPGWNTKAHYLVKQGKCPHCKSRIEYRFIRIGDWKNGKYTIAPGTFEIKKGRRGHTSQMKNFSHLAYSTLEGEVVEE